MTTSLSTRVSTDSTYAPTVNSGPLSSAQIDNNFLSLANNKLENGNNLSDLTNTATARTNIGLATTSSVQFGSLGIGTAASGVSGSITASSFTETSSIALKENINPISHALDSILGLNGVTYDRKDGSTKNEAGLIAEEVFNVLPNLCSVDENGQPLGINYTKLTAYLIEAVKELKQEIETLKGLK